ncbi:hypothetical protein PENSPDRAFT_564556, partial [Peniophora sp. CONT]
MNTVNASTGFSPFQLYQGRSPRLLPLLVPAPSGGPRDVAVDAVEAEHLLYQAKVEQAAQANKHCSPKHVYHVGDRIMLSTYHRRRDYKNNDSRRCAK